MFRPHCLLYSSSFKNAKTLALNSSTRLSLYRSQSRTLSTTNNEEPVEKHESENIQQKDKNSPSTDNDSIKPEVIFPWRHSAELLPRIDSKSSEYNPFGPELWIPTSSWNKRMFIHAVSARSLGKSWIEILFGTWENELCANFTWAFGRSVSSILAHTFKIPIDRLEKQQANAEPESDSDTQPDIIEVDFDSSLTEENSNGIKLDGFAQNLLEQNVLDQYKNAITDSRFQVRLLTRPMSAKLVNLNIIPYTRGMVQEKPELKGLYCSLLAAGGANNNDQYNELRDKFFNAVGKGTKETVFKTTVISQVLIHCKEIFYIKDKDTGKVIQGEESDVEKDVYHLVRFEIPVFNQANIFLYGDPTSWVVSDYDDLLNGNVFY